MISSIRIDLNKSGIGELLTRSETEDMLRDKAEDVAAAAREHAPYVGDALDAGAAIPLPIEVSSSGSGERAHAIVLANHWAGLAVEAKHRLLVSSLDAARW